jgi:multidrug efflux pump subunit AcrB
VPTGFIPTQDQGYLLMGAQLPDAASLERTEAVRIKLDDILHNVPGIAHTIEISGFSVLTGAAQTNACTIFVILKPFEERTHASESMNAIIRAITGKSAVDSAVEACRIRLRPILMTSVAFILGVLPLVIATGPGAEMRQALGTAVFSGMIGVTLFGLVLTPVFYLILSPRVRK